MVDIVIQVTGVDVGRSYTVFLDNASFVPRIGEVIQLTGPYFSETGVVTGMDSAPAVVEAVTWDVDFSDGLRVGLDVDPEDFEDDGVPEGKIGRVYLRCKWSGPTPGYAC